MSNGTNSAMNQIHGLAKGKSPVVVMTIAGLLGGFLGFVLMKDYSSDLGDCKCLF
jgi:ABC-type uncharacterized transport system permease subunit